MTRQTIIDTLRHCAGAEFCEECTQCPFRAEPEFPTKNENFGAICSDIIMRMAADLLEADGK